MCIKDVLILPVIGHDNGVKQILSVGQTSHFTIRCFGFLSRGLMDKFRNRSSSLQLA